MLDEEFERKYHARCADKCCLNCEYGFPEYEGELTCEHPERNTSRFNSSWHYVCDLWKKKGAEQWKV